MDLNGDGILDKEVSFAMKRLLTHIDHMPSDSQREFGEAAFLAQWGDTQRSERGVVFRLPKPKKRQKKLHKTSRQSLRSRLSNWF